MMVSVGQLKAHLRIQVADVDEDDYLADLIRQAQAAAEDFCQAPFGASTPNVVRLAILLMASHYYEYRDSSDKQAYLAMRMAFENLLWPYRDVTKLI